MWAVLKRGDEWREYWQAKGFPCRTDPEIDAKQRKGLSQCRIIVPDIKKGIYPFKGRKLSRADVEWLLATHENEYGPVDWRDENQRKREGLDLHGADLSNEVFSGLPLARMRGGPSVDETNAYQYHDMAAIHYAAKSKVRKK